MKNMSVIKVHQTLHGYNKGHNLLCASRSFAPAVARAMLVLSDLSSSRSEPGFESYLTAYPLPEIGSYVLARTWDAPEMKRPGCVWTNTLLIEFADLARIETLNQLVSLLALLQRPSTEVDADLTRYETPLSWPMPGAEASALSSEVRGFLQDLFACELTYDLLMGLYNKPAEPVFLLAEDANRYEYLILSLWLQQWPRLRRQFSFCTGVGTNRKHAQQSFDLQVVSRSNASSIKHELPSSTLLRCAQLEINRVEEPSLNRLENSEDNEEDTSWAEVAVMDLKSSLTAPRKNGSFREFLRFWGADAVASRAQYASLGNVFAAIEEVNRTQVHRERSLLDSLESMAQAFPQVKQAQKLKDQAFGQTAPNKLLQASETEVLKALVSTPYYQIFDFGSLRIQPRVAALWHQDPQAAQTLLLDSLQGVANPLLEEIIAAFARNATPVQAAAVANKVPSLAAPFVRLNPALLLLPDLWHGSSDLRRELLDNFTSSELNEEEKKSISVTLFEAGASELADELSQICGTAAARGLLEHLAVKPQPLDEPWNRLITGQADTLIGWLIEQISSSTLSEKLATEVIASLLIQCDPDAHEFDGVKVQDWVSLLNKVKAGQQNQNMTDSVNNVESGRLFGDISIWILTLALLRSGSKASLLVERTFQTAHDILYQQSNSFIVWKWLEKAVPSLPNKSWDRCERLRLAVVDQFVKKSWPLEQFTGAIRREDTLNRIILNCRQSPQGQELFKRVRQQVKAGRLTVPAWQQSVWTQKKKNLFARLEEWLF